MEQNCDRVEGVIRQYAENGAGTDPMGMYTGVPHDRPYIPDNFYSGKDTPEKAKPEIEFPSKRPRDGKIYMKINPDEIPVQDADDL